MRSMFSRLHSIPEAYLALLGFVSLTLCLVSTVVISRVFQVLAGLAKASAFGRGTINSPEPDFIKRVGQAHLNCAENLPLLFGVVLVAHFLGKIGVVNQYASLFIVLRVVQSLAHIANNTRFFFLFIRVTAFIGQILILAFWIIHLI